MPALVAQSFNTRGRGAGRGPLCPLSRVSVCVWKDVLMNESVAEGYAKLITRYDDMWNWYGHFTFRLETTKHGSVHPEKANKLFNHFLDKININTFGRYYKKRSDKGVLVARSTEIGGKGGLLHYHAVLGRIPDDVRRVDWKEYWNGLSGFARIYSYDRKLGGVHYLSKSAYAWKRGEIDFIGPWGAINKIMVNSYAVLPLFTVGGT